MAKCLRCGKTVNDSAAKCPYCGYTLKKRPRPSAGADEPQAKKRPAPGGNVSEPGAKKTSGASAGADRPQAKKRPGPSAGANESPVRKRPAASGNVKEGKAVRRPMASYDEEEPGAKGASSPEREENSSAERKTSKPGGAMIGTFIGIAVLTVCVVIMIILRVKSERENVNDKYTEAAESYNLAVEGYNMAVESYNAKVNEIISANESLSSAIDSARAVAESGEIPYEEDKLTTLNNTLNEASNAMAAVPESKEGLDNYPTSMDGSKSGKQKVFNEILMLEDMTEKLGDMANEIRTQEASLNLPDYSQYESDLLLQQNELENSYTIKRQITAPDQGFVMGRIMNVENVADTALIAEESNPEEEPARPGGYMYTVYFSTPLLGTENLDADGILKTGLNSGGAVEVYSAEGDAISRNDYYTTLDTEEAVLNLHQVLGSMVIRVSDKLEAADKEALAAGIRDALMRVD